MTKLYTHTEEIEDCSQCPDVLDWFDTGKRDWRCGQREKGRILRDIWGEIPTWCPLPDTDHP